MTVLWGIDLGGTKIEGLVVNEAEPQKALFRQRIPTEGEKGYDHILDQVANMCRMMAKVSQERPKHIGVGTPGSINPLTQTMKGANTTCLNGRKLQSDLENKLGIKVRLANDANCFALAETHLGVVEFNHLQANVVFGIIMGTGAGSGVVINGHILSGHHGIGGEWGHNFLDASGGKCYCGRIGCVETIISGPALEKYYESHSGCSKKLADIAASTEEDKFAKATIDRLLHFFGKSVGAVVNILDPDVIILGGGVGNIPQLLEGAHQAIAPYVFQSEFRAKIYRPLLGDSAGVFGAALL